MSPIMNVRFIAPLFTLALFSAPLFGQATRTWVSGVGDDANPCSRTAPCKTFAGAISKTAAGGEIDCLDSGGFGAVTITKAITLDGTNVQAGILTSGTNGIVINAGAGDTVTLRNLNLNGLGSSVSSTSLAGVNILNAGAVHIENTQISGFLTGVSVNPGAALKLTIQDSRIRDCSGTGLWVTSSFAVNLALRDTTVGACGTFGILLQPSGALVSGVLDHVSATQNGKIGLELADNCRIAARDCVFSGNASSGAIVLCSSAASQLALDHCTSVGNTFHGLGVSGALGTALISNCDLVQNQKNGILAINGGTITSLGGNRIAGNLVNGTPTTTTVPQ